MLAGLWAVVINIIHITSHHIISVNMNIKMKLSPWPTINTSPLYREYRPPLLAGCIRIKHFLIFLNKISEISGRGWREMNYYFLYIFVGKM